jgi:hypothetical protein
MHPQAIFHLVPKDSPRAEAELAHPDNERFVSLSSPRPRQDDSEDDGKNGPQLGLEIGYLVPVRPRPEVIAEVGRNADLILTGSSISAVQFSFETHPESKAIVFHDRSRYHNTTIEPFGFRTDGNIRQHVLQPGIVYEISAGGERGNLYCFELRWIKPKSALQQVERGYQMAEERAQNPRWARTVDDGPTELPSWYNTRLHTPVDGGMQRTTEGEPLGEGAFCKVMKAVDLDSGYPVAVKKVVLSKIKSAPSDLESSLRREVKTLSSLSHVRMFLATRCSYILTVYPEEHRRILGLDWLGHGDYTHIHEPQSRKCESLAGAVSLGALPQRHALPAVTTDA